MGAGSTRSWRVALWGAFAVLGATVIGGGLALLAGHRFDSRITAASGGRTVLRVFTSEAFTSCLPRLPGERTSPSAAPQQRTEGSGAMLTLSGAQLDAKAQCVFRHHQIDAATLQRVQRADRTQVSPIVPWWAPTTIVPTTAVVSIWAVLLAAWIGAFLILASAALRPSSLRAT
jgi:hypothetical protein